MNLWNRARRLAQVALATAALFLNLPPALAQNVPANPARATIRPWRTASPGASR
jgi:hypothetical protein